MARRLSTLLDHCPREPREVQRAAFRQIGDAWADADVFIISAPTGSGKSLISETIVRWVASARSGLTEKTGAILVPNNVLLRQYLDGRMPGFDSVRRRDLYACHEQQGWTCADRKKHIGGSCRSPDGNAYHAGACPYVADTRRARTTQKLVCTTHAFEAHKLKKDVVAVDEAHSLIPMLRSQAAVHLWRHEFGWREPLEEPEDILRWLSDELPTSAHDHRTDLLWRTLTGPRPMYILDTSPREYRGQARECVSLLPLDVRTGAEQLLGRAKKLVLMSATISKHDVAALGLDRRRVAYIELPSPIPAAQRPIEYVPVADMRFAGRGEATREMARWIVEEYLPAWAGHRGLIHATYAVADALRDAIAGTPAADRLMFHGRGADKQAKLDDFLAIRGPGDDRVLVGSGMEEGLDLAGDLARFQLITAIPRGNVADPATAWLAANRPEEYEWETIRRLVQASGRVARGPDDWGVTTIADSSAGGRELQSTQLPGAFRDALRV